MYYTTKVCKMYYATIPLKTYVKQMYFTTKDMSKMYYTTKDICKMYYTTKTYVNVLYH